MIKIALVASALAIGIVPSMAYANAISGVSAPLNTGERIMANAAFADPGTIHGQNGRKSRPTRRKVVFNKGFFQILGVTAYTASFAAIASTSNGAPASP